MDRLAFNFLQENIPSLAIIPDLRLTSLLLVTFGRWTIRKRIPKYPVVESFSIRSLSLPLVWLAATGYFVLVKKVWVPELSSWVDYVAFMFTGLIAEELLFRGILFDLSAEVFGFKKFARFSIPVWLTAALFGVQHLGYHNFAINAGSVTQVGYTFVMGLVFGSLRETSGRLWIVILVHMATNSFTVMRNLGWI